MSARDPRWDAGGEGEARKVAAHARLEARREAWVRRARRALLLRLLGATRATADDVADALGPDGPDLDPRWRGVVPGPLARLGIIRDSGRAVKSARPEAHARKITVWELADRRAALAWLARHPDLADLDADPTPRQAPAGSSGPKPRLSQMVLGF